MWWTGAQPALGELGAHQIWKDLHLWRQRAYICEGGRVTSSISGRVEWKQRKAVLGSALPATISMLTHTLHRQREEKLATPASLHHTY